MGIFKEKKQEIIDIAEFSGMKVSTGQVGAYIKKLYEDENFRHIGYRFQKNSKGIVRVIISAISPPENIIQYFKDRCPAMIENEVKECKPQSHTLTIINGFDEVAYDD